MQIPKLKINSSLPLLAVIAFATLTACSDNKNDGVPVVSKKNLVETAVENGNFNTLVTALEIAGLEEALSDPAASLTVFAPTDAAFEALRQEIGNDAYANLLASDDLVDILLYHVAGTELTSAEVLAADGDFVNTLSGKNVVVTIDGSTVMVNNATVTDIDLEASNGVIHELDTVIVPPSASITDIVVNGEDFSVLETAVVQAGLADTLADGGPFTVFAPTNAAFEKLGQETIEAVLANDALLTNILQYHVIEGQVSKATAASLAGQAATMLNEESAAVDAVDSALYIDKSKISVTNILTSNGVIHVIDSVMIPDGVGATDGDVVDILAADDNFSTLVTAVTEAGLVDILKGEGPFTVFAPSNSAFDNLPEGTLASLLEDIPTLSDILTYHVLPGEVDSAGAVAAAGTSVTMQNGVEAAITSENGGLFIDGAQIIMTDIPAANGVIHVIDAIMLP